MDSIFSNPYKEINYVPKGSSKKYKFVSKQHSCVNNGMYKAPSVVFYQLSNFPHPKNGMHHIRRFEVDGTVIKSIKENYLTTSQFRKFVSTKSSNKYRVYANVDLNTIGNPTSHEMASARSEILAGNNNYTGFAQI